MSKQTEFKVAKAQAADLDRLVEFFRSLPPAERNALRVDVTQKEPCRVRLAQIDGRDHWRMLAEASGRVVADATLDREPHNWTRHVAQLRLIVAPDFLPSPVGPMLLHALLAEGDQAGIERLTTEVLPEQHNLIAILEGVGFEHEFVRKRYAKNPDGRLRDVLVLSNDLNRVWERLAEQMAEMDLGTQEN